MFLSLSVTLSFHSFIPFKANFKESYMAAFYDYFNEQKYADAVKNVSVRPRFSLRAVNLCQFVHTPSNTSQEWRHLKKNAVDRGISKRGFINI